MSYRIVVGLGCVILGCVGDAPILAPPTDGGAASDAPGADTNQPLTDAGSDGADATTQPSFAWTRQVGSSGSEFGAGVAIDPQGIIYLGGSMGATLNTGSVTLNNIGNDNKDDGFLIKFSGDGTATSGQVIGGPGAQRVAGVVIDQGGQVFLNVGFSGATTIGNTTFNPDPDLIYDFLIARYDVSGNSTGAIAAIGPGVQTAWAFAPLKQGVVLCGANNGTIKNFLGSDLVASAPGTADLIVAKLFTGGSDYRAQYTTKQTDNVCGVSADANDNYVVGGSLKASLNFGLGVLNTANSGQSADEFLVKFSPTNTALWNTQLYVGGGSSGQLDNVSSTPNGEVYGGGLINGTWSGLTLLQSSGPSGAVYKLASTGGYIWSKVTPGLFWQSFAGDKIGRLAVCGVLSADTDLGKGPIKHQGGGDVALVVYAANGDVLYADAFGDNSPQSCTKVAFAPNGDVVMSGSFQGTMTIGADKLTTLGSTDIFLSRLKLP
jgi:hypothetical protein